MPHLPATNATIRDLVMPKPLGSNFMNPIMMLAAALVAKSLVAIFRQNKLITISTLVLTATLAGIFFVPAVPRPIWMVLAGVSGWLLALPAAVLLVGAGYWLDPVVSFTADASHAPKGLIGFFVLAALTSWPEFRSCLGLLRRGRTTSAVLNITVSNITNLWLAAAGVLVYTLLHL